MWGAAASRDEAAGSLHGPGTHWHHAGTHSAPRRPWKRVWRARSEYDEPPPTQQYVTPAYGVPGEEELVSDVAQTLINSTQEVAALSAQFAEAFNRVVRQNASTPFSTLRRNDGSFKRWLVQCGFVIGPLYGYPARNRADVSLPALGYVPAHAAAAEAAAGGNDASVADENIARGAALRTQATRSTKKQMPESRAKNFETVSGVPTPDANAAGGTPEYSPGFSSGRKLETAAGRVEERGDEDADAQVRVLMALLREDSAEAPEPCSEPEPLSLDEQCLWAMQAREDAELGADKYNDETFGADAGGGWSFEENLRAVEQLAASREAPPRPRPKRRAEPLRQSSFASCSTSRQEASRDSRRYPMQRSPLEPVEAVRGQRLDLHGGSLWHGAHPNIPVPLFNREGRMPEAVRRLDQAIKEVVKHVNITPEYFGNCVKQVIVSNSFQTPALYMAAELGKCETIPLLVALKADPSAKDHNGRSPIDFARIHQQWDAVRILAALESGTSVEEVAGAPPEPHTSSPSYASGSGEPKEDEHLMITLIKLMKHESEESDVTGEAARERRRLRFVLHELVKTLNLLPQCANALMCLAETGRNVVGMAGSSTTALHVAVRQARDDIIPLFVNLGASPDDTDSFGRTAMQLAIETDRLSAIWALHQRIETEGVRVVCSLRL